MSDSMTNQTANDQSTRLGASATTSLGARVNLT